jgi:hypothetical protein
LAANNIKNKSIKAQKQIFNALQSVIKTIKASTVNFTNNTVADQCPTSK